MKEARIYSRFTEGKAVHIEGDLLEDGSPTFTIRAFQIGNCLFCAKDLTRDDLDKLVVGIANILEFFREDE